MCCSTTRAISPPIPQRSFSSGRAACRSTAAFSAACSRSFCSRARRGISILSLGDITCAAGTIGIFLGRIANFINGELWGRPTDVPWGMVFPTGGPLPRHPSQLYEAVLEGLVLFVVLNALIRAGALKRPGFILGAFAFGYGLARAICEHFREPDPQLGFLWGGLTMGTLLSLPLMLAGIVSDGGGDAARAGTADLMAWRTTWPRSSKRFAGASRSAARCRSHNIWRFASPIPSTATTRRAIRSARAGDFTTAPEISQMFGELLGLWAAAVWRGDGIARQGPPRGARPRPRHHDESTCCGRQR